jgi:type VI secretion system protein ImpB
VAKESSQKFVARNRAPRVQIEYDVEVYGAEKKVQLPFVMGVMSDLSGKQDPDNPLPPVAAAFQVPNTLTGEGNINVDITFESMDDFSPAAIARKVGALNKLLQARTQLSNLVTYMDGKTGAEELIAKAIADPALLEALVSSPNPDGEDAAETEKDEEK